MRDGGRSKVVNRPVYVAIGVTVNGERDSLRFVDRGRLHRLPACGERPRGTSRPNRPR